MTDISRTVAAYQTYIHALSARYPELQLGAPAVTNGPEFDRSLSWLSNFLRACGGCKVDFIAIHWYDSATNFAYFKKHVQDAHTVSGGRPVWITEFKPSGSEAQVIEFLRVALPWLDGQWYVEQYAMQWVARGELVDATGTALTAVGNAYNII